MITFAVGDIHGCFRSLQELLGKIQAYAAEHETGDYKLVFLGDYVDRGPDSAQCVAMLRKLEAENPNGVVCLMGNHEQMMYSDYDENPEIHGWLDNGGYQTLKSYEGDMDRLKSDVEWMRRLLVYHQDEHRFYVHAGLIPGPPMTTQGKHVMLWVREEFLWSRHRWDKYVVHGHSPTTGLPDVKDNRCNLDTGSCFLGGMLTAGIFHDDKPGLQGYIQVHGKYR
jgi:diadenosine tetraphosphatase ApaH/serine/threonine PP2A family protein phosphatase